MKNGWQRVLAVFLSMLAGLAGGAALQSPASAALADCPQAYVCLWADSGFNGQRWQWFPSFTCLSLSGGNANNVGSSAAGKNGAPNIIAVEFFDGSNCTGASQWFSTGVGTITVFNSTMNNKPSSIKVVRSN